LSLGWKPYQNDHEDANGQFEMNWEFDEALLTADRHAFFKYMAKSIAEKHGLRATFMPKPFIQLTGNGCHMHVSMWRDGTNVFEDASSPDGLSATALHFIGGVINAADAMAAFLNPTVNSYKRINAPRTTSGATWAPNSVTWTGNNRTHMIRVPGRRLDINMYTDGHTVGDVKKLPLNLLDALRALEGSEVLNAALGPLVPAYLKLKYNEWNDYACHLTEWERATTLDC
jgi:glutamine synthetase